jgi:cytochrome o ubiquinol oxidase subunit 2
MRLHAIPLLLPLCLLGGCRDAGVLAARGPIAAAERLILINATAIMLVVVVPVIVLTLAFGWWYRSGNARATYRPDWSYSGQIELVVWAIPAMTVTLLAAVGWIGSHQLDPARKIAGEATPLRIQVVSLDWKWLFIYPQQHLALLNELIVPVGVPLEFELTSATVMNAFFIPQLGSQIYTMPGMSTHLNLLAARGGDYPGFSSHFSGDGFSDMRFIAHAVPAASFPSLLEQLRSGAQRLDDAARAQLMGRGSAPAIAYRDPDPQLYQQLLQQPGR